MLNDINNIKWPEWETVQLIGRGSYGAVYEIQRDVLGETEKAALKVISIPQNDSDIEEMYNDGYDDESITSTFKSHLESIVAEYSLMRKMSDCVNIVNCDDIRYVQHDDGIGWDIFIKMELLTPLAKALPTEISEQTVIKLAKDICTALDTCKKHNIIHRDIKPQNIFVSENGDYKLGDFGIAKTVEKTMGGTKIGTYKYMAPEVYNNQPYGTAADIYSLGLVLYWMLNDRRLPFMPPASQKMTAGMEEEARRRRFAGEQIPAPKNGSSQLKSIVLKACAYDPALRYKTPREMYDALQNIGNKYAGPSSTSTSSSASVSTSAFGDIITIKNINDFFNNNSNDEILIEKIKNYIFNKAKAERNIDLASDNLAVMRITEFLEKNLDKIKTAGMVTINLPYIAADAKGPYHIDMSFSLADVDLLNDKSYLDVTGTAVITADEAANGCIKTVVLSSGKQQNIKFPAGAKHAQVFKLIGCGNQDAVTGAKGDAYVTIKIKDFVEKDCKSLTNTYGMAIESLGLSVATYNQLKRNGINTVGDVCGLTMSEITNICGLGSTALELCQKIENLGMALKKTSNEEATGFLELVVKGTINPLGLANDSTYSFVIDGKDTVDIMSATPDVSKKISMPCGYHTVALNIYAWNDKLKKKPYITVKSVTFQIQLNKTTQIVASRPGMFGTYTMTVN